MPPLVAPLYYDENGYPVYADSVPSPGTRPVEPGMYEAPYEAPGQYAAPPPTETYIPPGEGQRGPIPVPTGWQHGAVGTGGGRAGGMMTSYPGGGGGSASGLGLSQILEEDPMRFGAPYGASSLGGPPALESGEQGPGQYQPMYQGPGYITQLPPYSASPPPRTEGPSPLEPGIYSDRYEQPGQAVPTPMTNEPGMYEPHYAQPGYYTPRNASTYYGGQIWPTPYTGRERAGNLGAYQPGPRSDAIQIFTPATGETTMFRIPDYGTAQQITPNAGNPAGNPATPGYRAAGQSLLTGGAMTKQPTAALGPTGNELAYRASQGDPEIVRNAEGNLARGQDLLSVRGPVLSRLGGLFGGSAPRAVLRGSNRPLPSRMPRGRGA